MCAHFLAATQLFDRRIHNLAHVDWSGRWGQGGDAAGRRSAPAGDDVEDVPVLEAAAGGDCVFLLLTEHLDL